MSYQPIPNPLPASQSGSWSISGTVTTSGLTDAQLRASAVPVSLSSLPALATGANVIGGVTQSGTWTVGVSGSVAVTGTFWQATQPVSGTITANAGSGTFAISAASLPLPSGAATSAKQPALGTAGTASTDVLSVQGIAGMTALKVDGSAVTQPVSGTFWQATQPVSGTVTANAGTGTFAVSGPLTDTQLRASAVPVSLPALAAGSAIIGKVGIDQTTVGTTNAVSLAQIGANAVLTGNGTTGTGSIRVTIASDNSAFSVNANQAGTWNIGTVTTLTSITNAVAVTPPALTKGTQGSTGFSVQDLKDGGRAIVNAATAIAGVTAVTTEALISLNVSRDGAATASATSLTVTSGKRFRVTHVVVGLISTSAAVLSGRFSLRMNPSGAVTASSPIIATLPVPSGAALAQAGGSLCMTLPDGIEFSGTMQFGISQVCSATTGTVWASIIGFEY